MTEVLVRPGACPYWHCGGQPEDNGFCALHQPGRYCRRCGTNPYGSRRLTRGYCVRCYSWWQRNRSPHKALYVAAERARAQRRKLQRQQARERTAA